MTSSKNSLTKDIVIQGGGPVGLMTAIGFAKQGKQVLLVEKTPESKIQQLVKGGEAASFDGRVLALTLGSQQFLEQLGVMASLKPFTTAIQHVHISQQGFMGLTLLHADEVDAESLGFSVMGADLGKTLWQTAMAEPLIEVVYDASISMLDMGASGVALEIAALSEGLTTLDVNASMVIGADGTESQVRQLLNLPMEEKAYGAYGVIAKVRTECKHEGWSFERFTESGPVALLPLNEDEHKAVYVCPDSKIDEVMAWTDDAFIEAFSERMGERLGAFTLLSKRLAYPLKEAYAPEMGVELALLIGNASHTQHPVAAQGLNLGIRDISVLLEMLCEVDWDDKGALRSALENYQQQRQVDHKRTMGMTDGLIKLFQTKSPLLGHLRGLGLMALERMPNMKKRFTKRSMGVGSES